MGGTKNFPDSIDVEEDCKALYNAMKGLGTNEAVLIKVIAHRSNDQLQEIRKKYKALYGKDLIEHLKSELSGNLENAVVTTFMTRTEHDAHLLRTAIKGMGTDEDTLIEVLVSRSNSEIKAIKEHYKTEYGKDLEKDIKGDTSGDIEKILVALVQGERSESEDVDSDQAEKEAQVLVNAGENKWGTDEASFIRIFASRSWAQLRATFEEYDKISPKGIIKALKGELSGWFETAMVSIVEYARNPHLYFAQQFRQSMKGMGTADTKLVRLVVSRCEIDLAEIANKYQAEYEKTLVDAIRSEISGDYRKFITQLVSPTDE